VPTHLVETIVAAGQRSSTSSNLQTYSVVAIADADKRARLAELCGNQRHIPEAPIFLAWCADLSRLDRVCRSRAYRQVTTYVESFLVAVIDAAIAMQTAALAAESLGLGICYIGAIRNQPQDVIDLLELPPLVFPISGMTVGWPATEPFIRPRLPLRAILHWETYDTSGEADALGEYDRAMIETGIYKGRQVPVPGGEGQMEDYGWQEHSARRASTTIRNDLRQVLDGQQFGLQ
jgi:FMN reductase (NADPH)